jgi:hypothetical protein
MLEIAMDAVRFAMIIAMLMLTSCRTPAVQTETAPAMTTPESAAILPQTTDEALSHSTGDGPMPPQTLPEWIKGANLILQGTVVRVVKEGYTTGFDPATGELLWRDAPSNKPKTPGGPTPTPSPLIPATNFEIKPDTVYRDDDWIASGKPLIISVIGRLNSADTDQTAMPQIGRQYLFVLNQNPDKATYGSPRECNLLQVTADKLQCLGQGSHLLPFMQGVTPAEFLEQLRSAAK